VPEDPDLKIRKFESRDAPSVKSIFHDTALLGEPASLFFEGRGVFSDALTLYFTDYEPQSCFVAEVDSKVVGCLTGTKDKMAMEKVFNARIAPGLFYQAVKEGVFLKKKNLIFMLNCLKDALRGRFAAPDFTREYPAILHINIMSGFRGRNIGSRLIESYLEYLKKEGVKGVHLATMSDSAGKFFSGLGFKLLHTSSRSYFKPVLKKEVPFYIYGMKLL